jgi:hypothetical protein
MPRKQRFKPSRKPKPIPLSEDNALGQLERGVIAHNENVPGSEAPQSPMAGTGTDHRAQAG